MVHPGFADGRVLLIKSAQQTPSIGLVPPDGSSSPHSPLLLLPPLPNNCAIVAFSV
jgi:hypothetical protein